MTPEEIALHERLHQEVLASVGTYGWVNMAMVMQAHQTAVAIAQVRAGTP